MSLLGDMAFGAMDHVIRTEAEKLLEEYVSSLALNQLIAQLKTRQQAVTRADGTFRLDLTAITITYTGTAMGKTQNRTLTLPDRKTDLTIDTEFMPGGKEGPAGTLDLRTKADFRNIGFSKSVGSIKATINALSFELALSGSGSVKLA